MPAEIAASDVCLVTGAARGIGAAVAIRLAAAGRAVAVNYRASKAEAAAVVEQITRAGGRAVAFAADVSDPAEAKAMFEAVDREFGPVTALVNNAGISGGRHRFQDLDLDTLRRVLAVNLVGPTLCAQMAVRRMARSAGGRGGAIVNISSQAVRTGGRQLAHYVASKAAIEGLTLALAHELAPEGIRVNVVSPGVIATDMQALDGGALQTRMNERVPLGRVGMPNEVADAVAWLIGPEAAYITGIVVPVAGGR
jgi:NAD(P)-dependent dehydrogenase (short-subunit alcohol dehydrogenase family)